MPPSDISGGVFVNLSATVTGASGYGRWNDFNQRVVTFESEAFADDNTYWLPDASSGFVIVSANAEMGIWLVQANGTVAKLSGTVNTTVVDMDGKLCVFQAGAPTTTAIVKNRLGASAKIRIVYYR